MVRLAAALIVYAGLTSAAWAQLTSTPGPGGIPIAPGAPPAGYTPGGVGIGGGRIAPGPAAAGIPMYRRAPGGVPVLVTPERNAEGAQHRGAPGMPSASSASVAPCAGRACLRGGLSLTIDSNEATAAPGAAIDSMQALKAALRACWTPEQRRDVQMSLRFGFRRSGELIGAPFVTYTSPGVNARARRDYRRAITSALDRCAPLKFSPQFASAIAGQPISVRFVDHRKRP